MESPEPVLKSLLDMIIGIKRPNHTDQLLQELFGSQPAGLFEVIALAANSALMEYAALDLLSTLIDDMPRAEYEAADDLTTNPKKVLTCEERSTILGAELRQEVVGKGSVNFASCEP